MRIGVFADLLVAGVVVQLTAEGGREGNSAGANKSKVVISTAGDIFGGIKKCILFSLVS